MKIEIKRKTFDDYISDLIVIHLFLMCGKNMLVALVPFFYNNNSIFNLCIMMLFAVFYIRLFLRYNVFGRMSSWAILFLGVIGCFLFASIAFNGGLLESGNVVERLRTFVAYCIPLFIAFNASKDSNRIWEKMFKYNFILWIIATICFLTFMATGSTFQLDSSYNMSYGNNLMFVILIFIFDYWINFHRRSLILSFISFFYLLAIGSRGPVLSIGIAYIIVFIFIHKKSIGQYIIRFALSIIGFIGLLNWGTVVQILINICKQFGIESRTISRLGSISAMLYNSHRNVYHDGIKEALRHEPLGLGAFGGDYTVGLAHSFYWDIFANMGYIFGIIFIITFVFAIFYRCYAYRDNGYSYLVLLFSIMLLPRGFFDGTFWGSYEMWVIIAMLFNKFSKYGQEMLRRNSA